MKKTLIILMILTMMLSMAACGEKPTTTSDDTASSEIVETELPTTEPVEAVSEEETEFVKMFELSNIEYVMGNGETYQPDFIPGSEVFIFRESEDSLSFDYKYKNYPTEEDMINDRNYTIETISGTYSLNSDQTQVVMLGEDGLIRYAEASEDKITFEFSPEGYDAKMVRTYTVTDEISI